MMYSKQLLIELGIVEGAGRLGRRDGEARGGVTEGSCENGQSIL